MPILKLRDQELECIEALPPGLLFDLSDIAGSNNMSRTLMMYGRFFRTVVAKKDHERLDAILYDTENVITFNELSEAIGELVEEYTNRPTERPSSSPTGADATGGPSRVVSLSPGTVRAGGRSSRAGRSIAS